MMLITAGRLWLIQFCDHIHRFRLFPLPVSDDSIPRRTFVMEDPYDGRNEYKTTDNRSELLHSQMTDDDTLSRDKLDMLFGNWMVRILTYYDQFIKVNMWWVDPTLFGPPMKITLSIYGFGNVCHINSWNINVPSQIVRETWRLSMARTSIWWPMESPSV